MLCIWHSNSDTGYNFPDRMPESPLMVKHHLLPLVALRNLPTPCRGVRLRWQPLITFSQSSTTSSPRWMRSKARCLSLIVQMYRMTLCRLLLRKWVQVSFFCVLKIYWDYIMCYLPCREKGEGERRVNGWKVREKGEWMEGERERGRERERERKEVS